QNNSPWFSFTTPSAIPFDVPPKGSVPVRVSINATGLNAGVFTDRLLVTSNDTARSPYPTGVFINLNVTDSGGGGGCTFTISPSSQSFNASGGTGSVGVTAPGGCPWTAVGYGLRAVSFEVTSRRSVNTPALSPVALMLTRTGTEPFGGTSNGIAEGVVNENHGELFCLVMPVTVSVASPSL